MDPRVQRAQQLFWEVEAQRAKGVYPAALPQLLEMARLHEERARELLQAGELDGWTDLFAAVTAWGEARRRHEASKLLDGGRIFAATLKAERTAVDKELSRLEAWLDSVPPAAAASPADTANAAVEPIAR